MNSNVCLLITILCNDEGAIEAGACIHKVALKIEDRNKYGDLAEYPMEEDNREVLHKMLPPHIQNIGPIIDVSVDLVDVLIVA